MTDVDVFWMAADLLDPPSPELAALTTALIQDAKDIHLAERIADRGTGKLVCLVCHQPLYGPELLHYRPWRAPRYIVSA